MHLANKVFFIKKKKSKSPTIEINFKESTQVYKINSKSTSIQYQKVICIVVSEVFIFSQDKPLVIQ